MDNNNVQGRLKALEETHVSLERILSLEKDHVTIERIKAIEDTVSSKDLLKEQLEQSEENILKRIREEFHPKEWDAKFEAMNKIIEEANEQTRIVNANFDNTASRESSESLKHKLSSLTKRIDNFEDSRLSENS